MDILDSQLYYSLKESIRKANSDVASNELGIFEMPIILVDFYNYKATYFNDEHDVKVHVEKELPSLLDEYSEGIDEELVLIKYCTDEHKERWDILYEKHKPYKKINGVNVYREITYIEFELETTVNINV